MKLEAVRVFVVGNPPPGLRRPLFHLLKLTTDCGIEGVGEVYAATFGPHDGRPMIEDVFALRSRAKTRSASRACGAGSTAPATRCAPMSR